MTKKDVVNWSQVLGRIIFTMFPVSEDNYCFAVFDRDIDEQIPVYSTQMNWAQITMMFEAMRTGQNFGTTMMSYADALALIERGELPVGFEWKKEEEK